MPKWKDVPHYCWVGSAPTDTSLAGWGKSVLLLLSRWPPLTPQGRSRWPCYQQWKYSLLGLYWHYRNGELEGCIITDERAYKSSSLYGLYCSYRFKGSSVSPNRDESLGSLAHLLCHDPCGRRGVMVSPYCLATVEIWSTHLTFAVGSGSRSTDFLWCLSGEERSKSYVLLRLSPFYCFGLKDKGFLIFIFDCICWHF